MKHILTAALLVAAAITAAPAGAQQAQNDERGPQPVETERAVPDPTVQQQVRLSEMVGLEVYDEGGGEIATVDRVVVDPQSDEYFVVLSYGGFFGIGGNEAAVPLERFILQGDRLMVRGVERADLESMADAAHHLELPEADGEQQIGIGSAD